MNRTASWKSITVGAVMAAMSFAGATTAQAAPAAPAPATMAPAAAPAAAPQAAPAAAPPAAAPAGVTGTTTDCTTGGAYAERCQTNGSTAIHTAPRPTAYVRPSLQDLLSHPLAD
jgi:hypothetical protein